MPTTLTIFHGKLQLEEGTYVAAATLCSRGSATAKARSAGVLHDINTTPRRDFWGEKWARQAT